MSGITKIYELKSQGYDKLISELHAIEQAFVNIAQAKRELNAQKASTVDSEQLKELNRQLNEAKIKTAELKLARQELINQTKAAQVVKQAEINQSRESTRAAEAEAGSLTKVTERIKLLKAALGLKAPTSMVSFEGQNLSYEQATTLLQQLRIEEKGLIEQTPGFIKSAKTKTEAVKAEAGSYNDLIEKAKFLKTALNNIRPDSTTPIIYNGQNLNYSQAVNQLTQLNQQSQAMAANMGNMGNVGGRVNTALANGFNNMKNQLGSMIVMYTGWFAAFNEAGKLIHENIELSDSFADLQIRIKGTKEDVSALFDELKKIDTRTSLKDLVDIANVVSKKGVAREDIVGLTQEFDKLNVVLGKEIGEPGTATASIIKLITIFNDDKHITAQRVSEIGSSLFKLTTSGVATGEFLINFAERVGAVRGITGLTLPAILGMGAAMQQLGQRTEVAGTAAVQLTTRIFSDIPKFAKAAGKSIQEFRELLDKDPFEALLAVAEGLKNIKGDEMAAEFEEVVKAFGEVGVTGVRIKAVLGDIATNGQFVRDRMKAAAVSTADYANQSAAAEIKQHTFAATLDRVRKKLEELGTNQSVQIFLAAVASLILVVVSNLGLIIGALGVYGAAWLIANNAVVIAWTGQKLLAIYTTLSNAALVIGNTFVRAYTVALSVMTGMINRAAAATQLWALASQSGFRIMGLLIVVVGALAAATVALGSKIRGTTEELKRKTEAQRIEQEVAEKANAAIAEQVSKMESLVRIVTSAATSYDTSRIALDKLVEINGKFNGALDGTAINLRRVKDIMKEVRDEIELNARAQASATFAAEKYKDYLDVVSAKQGVESKVALAPKSTNAISGDTVRDIDLTGMSDITKKLVLKASRSDAVIGSGLKSDLRVEGLLVNRKAFYAELARLEDEAYKAYQDYAGIADKYNGKVAEQNAANAKKAEETKANAIRDAIASGLTSKLSIEELDAIIKEINSQRDKLKEGNPLLDDLLRKRNIFQARLDELRGKTKTKTPEYRGARLTGEQKDDFSEIDARMKAELLAEETRFAKLQLDHRATYEEEITYTNNIKIIHQKYLDQKIAKLEAEKSLNAKELLTLATFRKEKMDLELKAMADVQAIKDKQFNLERSNLKAVLDNQIAEINQQVAIIEADASITNEARAQARLDGDRRILVLQEQFNDNIDALEKKLNQKTRENAREGAKTREDIIKDAIAVYNALFRDASDAADRQADEIKIRAANRTTALLQANKSAKATARELAKIQEDESRELLANEIAQLQIEVDLYKEGLSKKIKSEKDYMDAKAKLQELQVQMTEDATKRELTVFQRFTKSIRDFAATFKDEVLGIKSYDDTVEGKEQRRADAVKDAQNQIREAMQQAYDNFFNAEKNKIDHERDAHIERLDREKELVKARATSQAEIDSIEKQYEARKKAAEKKAAEDKKKLALKEIAIDFAISIVKSIAQYGLPLALLPIAAATALYFVQRSAIQSQQFEKGGTIPKSIGGWIRGNSHAQGGVKFNYEAEDAELAIINKNSARDNHMYTITGTPGQIASQVNVLGGGVDFQSGGRASKLFAAGGLLGSNYPAPTYTPSTSFDMSPLLIEIRGLAIEQSKRIDRMEVIQVTDTVTDAQKKAVKQYQIGNV